MRRFSPAKVNLGLSVLGRRGDGYHELHTLFAALPVGDWLTLEPTPQQGRIELTVQGADLPLGMDNLAYRAAWLYLEGAGWPGGVRLHLEKHLPVAAGLGGGSSNAAAALLGLAELYPAPLDLGSLARALGADVPFFLRGGWAEAGGIGERLRPVEPLPLALVLVNPGLAVRAAEAYRALRPEDYGPPLPLEAIRQALAAGLEPPWWNSLEASVFRLYPGLAELAGHLRALGLRGVLLSGSGSSFFGLAADPEEARWLARKVQAALPQCWVRAVY